MFERAVKIDKSHLWHSLSLLLLSLLLLVFSIPSLLFAQKVEFEYTVRVLTDLDDGVEAVNIYGDDGVDDLNGRLTDESGTWRFDLRDLERGKPTLHFLKSGYKFEPAELTVDAYTCPDRLCVVRANPAADETVLIRVSAVDYFGNPISEVSTLASGAFQSCTKKTDTNGIAYFSTTKRSNCNDQDANHANDFSTIFIDGPEDGSCQMLPLAAHRRSICPSKSMDYVLAIGNCGSNTTPSALAAGSYEISVRGADDAGLQPTLHIVPGNITLTPNGQGKVTFTPANHGLSANAAFSVIPEGSYQFYPKSIFVDPRASDQQRLRFRAKSSSHGQGLLSVLVSDSNGNPTSGVEVEGLGNGSCGVPTRAITDADGIAFMPSQKRSACDDTDAFSDNDSITFSAELSGCAFSDPSDTPFELCPASNSSSVEIHATCSGDDIARHKIQGLVFDPNGLPLPRVNMLVDGVLKTSTRNDGSYSFYEDAGTSFELEPSSTGTFFDPSLKEFLEITESLNNINFMAVDTIDGYQFGKPSGPCFPSSQYTIHGVVYDGEGQRLSGATIFNNHEQVAVTGADGSFSVPVEAYGNNWISAEFEDEFFDPAAVSIPFISCDEQNVNFQVTDEVSFLIGGLILNSKGEPFQEVGVTLVDDDETHELITDESGYFAATVLEGSVYKITPTDPNYLCTPQQFTGEAWTNQAALNFTCQRDLCPTDPTKLDPGVCGCGTAETDTDQDGTPNCVDQCDNDPAKSEEGLCGCGVSDLDSDSDGTPNCTDQCDEDAFKIVPGECGCGELESNVDFDNDGVLACNESCDSDPLKLEPGLCGCGIPDTDSDGDGTPNCNDQCENDSKKVLPGTCGCGVADTDSDKDGTPNCNDLCPNDRKKVEAGVCGCGVVDKDTDFDGTYDCDDQCINDPAKTVPGSCGCGSPDIDSDSDGTLDCNDECPLDPLKLTKGACGCGIADVDTDGDGVANCKDECPLDSLKSKAGQCGCGFPDTDLDSDGTANCLDLCEQDPKKTQPGLCGCGVSDKDTDKDGTPDCEDLCPNDKKKIEPGECGCGVVDEDLDGDGVYSCEDECDKDPLKVEPGECGCGKVDEDLDNDGVFSCNDECDLDPEKIRFGQCGCGFLETDTDDDGKADCVDECQTDPLKSKAGQCGCGFSDKDTDGDKTADCLDLCTEDKNKIEPGICGCGVKDLDTDKDGTYDCEDECKSDPEKIEAGICGCGIEDVDTDNDGTYDCEESCPSDPSKLEPGLCGCGIADTDTDGDGTPDCDDECSLDPQKIAAGQCGCGALETDSDNDGTADCNDECSADPLKNVVGQCGCGFPDTDTDKDGIANCNDICFNDKGKVEPGVCGCGIADTDKDKDGTFDCHDECIDDKQKIEPGICGCGVVDRDSDADGTYDCKETCPADPLKLAPGICGCGISDLDSDGDGIADCQDQCSLDPLKTTPGQCGCGGVDTDTDGDGFADCVDLCSQDAGKTAPGQCGCGIADTDTDKDGTPNCNDQCSQDKRKTAPGVCGCGIADTDTDRDGSYDCEEECDSDAHKTLPGICGCGVPDTDSDSDGLPDCTDLCPLDAAKTAPGTCGCGFVDEDKNFNNVMDCDEEKLEIVPLCIEIQGQRSVATKMRSQLDVEPSPFLADRRQFTINKNNKVTICHIPPGNPDNRHTIEVSENAVPAHIAHGDYEGECVPVEEEPETPRPTPTPIPTAIPTATPTPQPETPTEPSDPTAPQVGWRIINPNPAKYRTFTDILNSNQPDVDVVVNEDQDLIIYTKLIPGLNTAVLYVDGVEHDRAVHTFEICKDLPDSIGISGKLKGKNGQELSGALLRKMQRLNAGDLQIIATNYDTGIKHLVNAESPFNWMMEVDPGRMKISLKSKYLKVISKPTNYRDTYEHDQDGLHFAVRWDGANYRKRKRSKK